MKTLTKHLQRLALSVLAGTILSGAMGAQAWAVTAPAPTRVVTHPDWGGLTATQYLGALQQNYQYPDFDMAIDDSYDDLLAPWSDGPQQWNGMDPADTTSSSSSTIPQYVFTTDKTIVVGTSGDTLTATLTIAQLPTSSDTTDLHVVSAQLIGSTAYDGQTVASLPHSCSGAICSFTWTNPNLDAQYWGPLTIKATVTSNDYPGTWVVYKDFYSSPTMAGKFTGTFTDSIVNGSLVVKAGVQMYSNQQMACNVSGNLYSVAHGWPLQHYERTLLLDPTATSISFTFHGKIFTDYGDAGTFSLQDLKVQCLALLYPAAWYMDPITHKTDLQNWAAANSNSTTDPEQPPFIYFGRYASAYVTAIYPNSVFSSTPYQTPQQTATMVPDLVNFANAEMAGTAAFTTPHTDANGDTTYTNSAGLAPILILIHGRKDPGTCTDFPHSTDNEFHQENFGFHLADQCNIWYKPPDTNALKVYVQWNAWDHVFNDTGPNGGNFWVRTTIIRFCDKNNHTICNFICHSAGCAALEDVLARLKAEGQIHNYNLGNVLAAASAAGGSELADHSAGLPEGSITAHKVAKIDRSLKTGYARYAYNHNHMEIPIRAIGGTKLNSFVPESVARFFPHQVTNNTQCFQLTLSKKSVCADDDVSLHSGCGHRHAFFYERCGTQFRDSPHYDRTETYDWHGYWIDDSEDPSGKHAVGPFSQRGGTEHENSYEAYYTTHGGAHDLADVEYQACYLDSHPWLCP